MTKESIVNDTSENLTSRGTPRTFRRYGIMEDVHQFMQKHPNVRMHAEDIMRELRIDPPIARLQGAISRLRASGINIEIVRPGRVWIYHPGGESTSSEVTMSPEIEKLELTIVHVHGKIMFGVDEHNSMYKIEHII